MDREMEKAMKQFLQYLENHPDELDDDASVDDLAQRFMREYSASQPKGNALALPQTADDYLELAEEATSKKKRLEYLDKALELEPDNLDAALLAAENRAKDPEDLLKALSGLIEQGDAQMERGGYFQDSMGEFWAVLETRPYLRLRAARLSALIQCGMLRSAITEAQRMLELCENDNLGARYTLMHLYAYFEEEDNALALDKQYGEWEDTQLLLPLAVLYYKKQDFERSLQYLRRLNKRNKDTKKFFRAAAEGRLDECLDEMDLYAYRPFTIEELIMEYMENHFLFDSVDHFFNWANRSLKKPAGRPAK